MTTESQIFGAVWSVVRRRALDRGVAATELCDHVLRTHGKLRRVEGKLCAGTTVLDQDNTLLPMLARATSLGFSLYLGNRRIASVSVLGAGKPGEIGAYADAELVDLVLRKREIFKGTVQRGNQSILAIARPLYLGDAQDEGGAIGMIEAFQNEQAFYESLAAAARIGAEQRSAAQEEAADGMESVIHFLDDVARRLQLLALNGNIIASQAGEYGRAFRVVCRELGQLADRAKGTTNAVRKLMATMGLEGGDGHGEPAPALPVLPAVRDEADEEEPQPVAAAVRSAKADRGEKPGRTGAGG
jgi:hypothetical protein